MDRRIREGIRLTRDKTGYTAVHRSVTRFRTGSLLFLLARISHQFPTTASDMPSAYIQRSLAISESNSGSNAGFRCYVAALRSVRLRPSADELRRDRSASSFAGKNADAAVEDPVTSCAAPKGCRTRPLGWNAASLGHLHPQQ
jgi:hypothetical protein